MSELDYAFTKGLVLAQGCLIEALVRTHPNREQLHALFVQAGDQLVAALPNTAPADVRTALSLHIDHMMQWF